MSVDVVVNGYAFEVIVHPNDSQADTVFPYDNVPWTLMYSLAARAIQEARRQIETGEQSAALSLSTLNALALSRASI